jgi:hypothetical protein
MEEQKGPTMPPKEPTRNSARAHSHNEVAATSYSGELLTALRGWRPISAAPPRSPFLRSLFRGWRNPFRHQCDDKLTYKHGSIGTYAQTVNPKCNDGLARMGGASTARKQMPGRLQRLQLLAIAKTKRSNSCDSRDDSWFQYPFSILSVLCVGSSGFLQLIAINSDT